MEGRGSETKEKRGFNIGCESEKEKRQRQIEGSSAGWVRGLLCYLPIYREACLLKTLESPSSHSSLF